MALVLVLAIVGPVANPGPRHHGDEVGTHGTTPPANRDESAEGEGHMATTEGVPTKSDGPSEAEAVAWFALEPAEATGRLGVDPASGLSDAEVASRLASFGPNKFTETAVEPRWRAFVRQYRDPMQIVLLVAGIGSLYPLKELATGILLLFLTLFNAVLGLRQEGKAAEAVAALQKMMIVKASVRRDGALVQIPAEQLVPATSSRSRPAMSCRPTGACCRPRPSRSPSRR